ncbi:MAG: LacI family DNA-binding transcriptional regulator [Eubacteriales bacterium]|nr:LacI family DNA-binding transcriptional regulator [Eubacteriales bacterium]
MKEERVWVMSNIKDVAKMANVSISTVSHVINGTRFVSEETKEKVRQAMESLNYVPNVAAFSLRTKKSKNIGVVIPITKDETSNVFFMQVMQGIETVLSKNGYFLVLSNSKEDIKCEEQEIKNLLMRQVDGVIIASSRGDHSFIHQLLEEKEYVFIDRVPEGISDVDCIISDGESGSYEAVRYLAELGHRKIGVLCDIIGEYPNSDRRYQGYLKALKDSGIPFRREYVKECQSSIESGYDATRRIMEETDITALYVVSNVNAMGALQYFREAHISIPEDISMVIYDDYSWAKIYRPPLTVIRQEAFEMGRKSAELLLKRMNEPDLLEERGLIQMKTTLIKRESCRPI